MIWLLRHAKAADGHPDAERPLTERGLRDAASVGRALERWGVTLDACLSSPKRRAMQTAQLACAPLELTPQPEPALATGGYDPVRLASGYDSVLIVGHNPVISEAVERLSGARVRLRPGALAAIDDRRLTLLIDPARLAALLGGQDRSS